MMLLGSGAQSLRSVRSQAESPRLRAHGFGFKPVHRSRASAACGSDRSPTPRSGHRARVPQTAVHHDLPILALVSFGSAVVIGLGADSSGPASLACSDVRSRTQWRFGGRPRIIPDASSTLVPRARATEPSAGSMTTRPLRAPCRAMPPGAQGAEAPLGEPHNRLPAGQPPAGPDVPGGKAVAEPHPAMHQRPPTAPPWARSSSRALHLDTGGASRHGRACATGSRAL
jgi:hypothetical protein